MKKSIWKIGTLLVYNDWQDNRIYGVIIKSVGPKKQFRVQWFDGKESIEREDAENINIEVISY
jgi:hypothetical protein